MVHGPTLKKPNQKRVRNDLVDWGLFKSFLDFVISSRNYFWGYLAIGIQVLKIVIRLDINCLPFCPNILYSTGVSLILLLACPYSA